LVEGVYARFLIFDCGLEADEEQGLSSIVQVCAPRCCAPFCVGFAGEVKRSLI
jgi:hypothetical protein